MISCQKETKRKMCCWICWLQGLRCSVWICDWVETCFPFPTCNSVYGMAWFHLLSAICLLFGCAFSYSTHSADVEFNKNLDKNTHEFEKTTEFLNDSVKSVKIIELEYLIDQWYGMFDETAPRGVYLLLYVRICGIIALINLVLYLATIPIICRNCFCGDGGRNYYEHDWPWFKGKLGFIFAGAIGIMTCILLLTVLWETREVVFTEMIYEEHFPYCMRDTYFLQRFCIISKHELDHGDDLCEDIIQAFLDTYLCHEYYKKITSSAFSGLAVVFHIILTLGYAQMAYRPWAWEILRQKIKESAELKNVRQEKRKRILDGLEPKLKLEQARKKIKTAEINSRKMQIEREKLRLENEIREKNKIRRKERRASRKLRREKDKVERQKRRKDKKNNKLKKEKPHKPLSLMTPKEKQKWELENAKRIENKKREKAKRREKRKKEKLKQKEEEEKRIRKEIEKSRKEQEKRRRKEHLQQKEENDKRKKIEEKKFKEEEKALQKAEKERKSSDKGRKSSDEKAKNSSGNAATRAKQSWQRMGNKVIQKQKAQKGK